MHFDSNLFCYSPSIASLSHSVKVSRIIIILVWLFYKSQSMFNNYYQTGQNTVNYHAISLFCRVLSLVWKLIWKIKIFVKMFSILATDNSCHRLCGPWSVSLCKNIFG